MANQEKILLLDANALVHRSFHALPPLTSPKGVQVNAVYGFANALLKAIKDEKPNYVVACFDAGKITFRNDIYKEYKAQRKETDSELAAQFPLVKKLVEAMGVPVYAEKGLEADDLIGSLTQVAKKKNIKVTIVTGDNDALQLVGDGVCVYSLRRGVTDTWEYDRAAVKEKLGVYPEQIVDYKALAGDSSDNIPGAPGIGPKTAVEWLVKYQNLEGVYEHLGELSPRQQEILKENKKLVETSRQLAEIKKDLDMELDLDSAKIGNFDFKACEAFFHEFGFVSLLSKLPAAETKVQGGLFEGGAKNPAVAEEIVANARISDEIKPTLPFKAIETTEEWEKVLPAIKAAPYLIIDTETVDLGGDLVGISFAWSDKDTAYLPLAPAYPGGVSIEEVRASVQEIMGNVQIRKIGHNFKYDLGVLRRAGFEVEGIWFDTMLASGLVNTQLFTHKLDDIAFTLLNFKKIPLTQLIGVKKDASMATVPLEKLAAYSCEDALVTWKLWDRFKGDIEAKSLKKIFYEIEMPLLPVLEKMESLGIKIDSDYLFKLGQKLGERLQTLEAEIKKLAGTDFNVNSPSQLKVVLFDVLKLSAAGLKKVKSGYSTDAETLGKLRGRHPIIDKILDYRELAKLLNTYIETLPKLADKNGRVHTSFQQLGAATGRLSSQNPNLQNIPIRTDLGNEVRRAFVADSGKLLLGADYSQAELRILAHMSEDPVLIEAFRNKSDFHAAVAEELKVDRRTAKAINFGIVYGLGANGLANDLGITPIEAKGFIDRYFHTFPGVTKYLERMKQFARDNGYVETLFGRRRYLPDIHSPNPMLRASAERMAINMPSQGAVADLMELAMVKIAAKLPDGANMLLQIHDELLFEVDKDKVDELVKLIHEIMGHLIELKVPMIVDIKTGPNWADMRKN
ncbi:MAG TPA: DNA polymerase I [Candidatus Saccharimonadales bacterium]|nr:DNA polymerase I [Candidatus Saccharimonadales bacterium]